jgi:hypothetical protein
MIELEKMNDFGVALGIAKHIEHPCGMCIGSKEYTLRDFYIRMAKETLPELKNEIAKEFLSKIIKIYE